jgi:hypothetical protein
MPTCDNDTVANHVSKALSYQIESIPISNECRSQKICDDRIIMCCIPLAASVLWCCTELVLHLAKHERAAARPFCILWKLLRGVLNIPCCTES